MKIVNESGGASANSDPMIAESSKHRGRRPYHAPIATRDHEFVARMRRDVTKGYPVVLLYQLSTAVGGCGSRHRVAQHREILNLGQRGRSGKRGGGRGRRGGGSGGWGRSRHRHRCGGHGDRRGGTRTRPSSASSERSREAEHGSRAEQLACRRTLGRFRCCHTQTSSGSAASRHATNVLESRKYLR